MTYYGWRTTIAFTGRDGMIWLLPTGDTVAVWWDPVDGVHAIVDTPAFVSTDFLDGRIAHVKDSFFVSIRQTDVPPQNLDIAFWHLSSDTTYPTSIVIDTTLTLEDTVSMRGQTGNYHSQPHIIVRDSSIHFFYILWFDKASSTDDSCVLVTQQVCWQNGVAYPDPDGRDSVYIFSDDVPKMGLTGPTWGISNGDTTRTWLFIGKETGTYDTTMVALRVDLPDPPFDCVPWGACCDSNLWTCTDSVTQANCSEAGQAWYESQLCADIPCEEPPAPPTIRRYMAFRKKGKP
jgi:hypothetical protein